jgi:hypothetical protein
MLVVLLPVSAALVFGTAYLAVSMAAPRSRVGRWLALWLAVWGEVVLTVEVLSLLDAVTPLGFVVCYVAGAAVAVAIWLARGMPRVRLIGPLCERQDDRSDSTRAQKSKAGRKKTETRGFRGRAFRAFGEHPALGVLLVVVAICMLVNLVLAVGLPVNNHDANSYHLSRVGYWIQHGSTAHYRTHNARQNHMPPNAEFGILSVLIFARADWAAPLPQYGAYFVCLAGVYLIARRLGASNAAALFAAALLGTMTEVMLQATIPKNGLVVSSFLVCAVAFALVGLGSSDASRGDWIRAVAWSAVATGLAVGTKLTALLFVPALAIAGVVVAVGSTRPTTWLRRLAAWAACCVVSIVLLGSFNFIRTFTLRMGRSRPAPSRPHRSTEARRARRAPRSVASNVADFGTSARVARPTFRALVSNLARYGYHLCDFGAVLPRSAAHAATRARAAVGPRVFNALGIAANPPELNIPGKAGAFPVDDETGRFDDVPRLHEDSAWFGPIAFFVGVPLVLVHLVWSPLRRRWAWFGILLAPVVYWLLVCVLLRYSIWNGRYFVTTAVTAAPVLAYTYRPRWLGPARFALSWLLVAVAASTALTATFYNTAKPIVPKAAADDIGPSTKAIKSVLAMSRVRLRCRYDAPMGLSLCTLPEDAFPTQMTLGLVLGGDACDWPLFGPGLRRTLMPLQRNAGRVTRLFRSGKLDMVLISKSIPLSTMPPILGERPFIVPIQPEMTPLDIERMNYWSFVVRTDGDDNTLFPARDWQACSDGPWVDADQRFVPVRVLPAGWIVVSIKPNEKIVADTGLVFEFYGGDTKLGEIEVTDSSEKRFGIEWDRGRSAADQILRLRVRAKRAELDADLQDVVDVYRLLEMPVFVPAR